MANITVNIEGDLNIFVSGEDGQPECLYLDSEDGCPVGSMEIQFDSADECKAAVLYAAPGETAKHMTLYEALQMAMENGGLDSVEMLPAFDLLIAFNSDDVITDECGDLYLAGACMVFNVTDGDAVSLTQEQEETARKILKAGTSALTNGKERIFAYGL